MNLSLDNPYGDVTIPRAKLRSPEDSSIVIANPLAVDNSLYSTQAGRNSALNPYGSFKPPGDESGQPASDIQDGSAQNPPPYEAQATYTVKEDTEEVGRCNGCCRSCRKKK